MFLSTKIPRILVCVLVFGCSGIERVQSCKCQLQSPQLSFCLAHWVSRARVEFRAEKQRMPDGIVDRQTLDNYRYQVTHLEAFKKPFNFTDSLPSEVFSAEEEAACGITLEPKTEYLLSGRFVNGTMMIHLCGQILFDDRRKSREHDILEWAGVPESTISSLKNGTYSEACDDLLNYI